MFASRLKALPRAYWNLSLLQFLFWSSIATAPYLTVFLQGQGYRPNQVGLINAGISIAAIIATPFWGMIADRIQSIRKIFILCMFIGIILWGLIPASSRIGLGPAALVSVVIIFGALFRNPANSLFDAFSVQRADLDGLPYGHVRLWGSFSYALVSFILSIVLPRTGVEFNFYLYAVVLLPLLIIMWTMKGADAGRRGERLNFRSMGFGRLFGNYYFITYLFFAMFVYMPVNSLMVFLPYLIDAVGEDTARLGLINMCRALVEIPVLFMMRGLRRKLPLPAITGGAAVIFCVEAFLCTRVNSFYQIMLLQAFHGIGGGCLIGAASNYVYSLAPKGLNSTAHTVNGAVIAVAAIMGNLVGGYIILNRGIFSFYRVSCGMLFFALVYFCLSFIVGKKILKKPIPSLTAV